MNNQCQCDGCCCQDTSNDLKGRSNTLTSRFGDKAWVKRAPARAMMRAVGYEDEDFEKPLICVAAPYSDVSPCNSHILDLGKIAEEEIAKLGGRPYVFGTPV